MSGQPTELSGAYFRIRAPGADAEYAYRFRNELAETNLCMKQGP